MFRELWITAVGFAFSIVLGHFMTAWTVDNMRRAHGWKGTGEAAEAVRPHAWQARVVGIVERFLYTATTLIGQYGFIPVWLALKVVGQWKRRTEDDSRAGTAEGAAYSAFLVGSGISIVYGVSGGFVIGWLGSHQVSIALAVSGSLVVGNGLLIAYIKTLIE